MTCQLSDRLGNVVEKLREAGKDTCIVVTDGNVILGRLRGRALEGDPNALVEEVMESGPTTTRINTTLESMIGRMRERKVESILVTTSDGRLVGTMYRSDADRRLEEYEGQPGEDEASCDCNE